MLLKLAPSPEQHTALLETMHAFNDACTAIAQVAYDNQLANKFTLQKLVYAAVRQQFGLSSQMAIRAISKTTEAYKRDKSIQPFFRREGAITYDERYLMYKTSWQHIITNNFALPSQPSLAQLTDQLLSHGFADLTFVDEKPPQASELLPLVEDALQHIRVWW